MEFKTIVTIFLSSGIGAMLRTTYLPIKEEARVGLFIICVVFGIAIIAIEELS